MRNTKIKKNTRNNSREDNFGENSPEKNMELRSKIEKMLEEAFNYFQIQDFPAAIIRYRQVLKLHPVNTRALNYLGLIRKSMGEPRVAEELFHMAVNLRPNNPEYRYNLGNCLRDDSRFMDAIKEYHDLLKIDPKHFNAWLNLGDSYRLLGDYQKASEMFESARKLNPDDCFLKMNIANLCMEMGEAKKASVMYEDILKERPKDSRIYANCATAYKQIGKFKEAVEYYRKAVDIDPKMVGAIYSAVNIDKTQPDDPWFDILNRLKQDHRLQLNDKIGLYFALGKMYGDIGAYDESFTNYRDGNVLRNELSGRINRRFLPENFKRMNDSVLNSYSPEQLSKIRKPGILGDDEYTPIFIIGMPRSGTTLTEQILSSHPKVQGVGELSDIFTLAAEIDNRNVDKRERLPYPQNVELLDEDRAVKLASVYLARLRELAPGYQHVVDKMPGNYAFLGFIVNLFPAAKIIECRREPIDNCLSCYIQNFSRGHEYSNDLSDMAFAYKEYERIMNYWHENLPVKIYRCQYEDIIENHESSVRKLLEYCELEWDDAVKEYYNTPREIQTASVVQVRQPLYNTSIKRWEKYKKHLKPLIEELKYK